MAKQIPSYLKLVTETASEPPLAEEDFAAWAAACHGFEQLTGWPLEYGAGKAPGATSNLVWSAPVNPGVGVAPGHIRLLSRVGSKRKDRPPAEVTRLAAALGHLWEELLATRNALWQREAELAAGVPLVSIGDETAHLAIQLEAVLRGGAEAIGCHAAALYLLDPATSQLKLRASWGLPRRRFLAPVRPLRGAVADLEALLGHAVVLTDARLHEYWNTPERFASAVCAPVASPSLPLGTLWAFCREPREYSDEQTQVLEVVAGRLAADLERKVLLDEKTATRQVERQLIECERRQQMQYPSRGPLIDGWEIAGAARQAEGLGSAFYDWFGLADGRLTVAAGAASESGVSGAINAATLRAALRAQAASSQPAGAMVTQTSRVLWASSAGETAATVFACTVGQESQIDVAAAGLVRAIVIRAVGRDIVKQPDEPLGRDDSTLIASQSGRVEPGEVLIVYGGSPADGTRDKSESETSDATKSGAARGARTAAAEVAELRLTASIDEELMQAIAPARGLTAEQLADVVQHVLETFVSQWSTMDRFVLVIKRRGVR